MDIKGAIWFTAMSGSFGIVYGESQPTKERKAYIGLAKGKDEKEDMNHIAEYGAKLHPYQLKELTEFFNGK